MKTISPDEIDQRRAWNYRRLFDRRLTTVEQAQRFVDEIGFCFLWPIKDIELPNLFHAIAGHTRPVPMKHDDPDLSKCWGWKDSALGEQWWYYSKLLRRRATLISLQMLPYFYACSENYGDLDDYQQEYDDGLMTAEAKAVYEAILTHGPLDTVRLRRESHLSAESAKSRFDRALVELQVGMKVIPVGVAHVGAWNYAFNYQIVQRHYPELPAQARNVKRSEARRALVRRYLDNVVAANLKMIGKVFHVLRWTPSELRRTIDSLKLDGVVQEVPVEGTEHTALMSTGVAEG